MIHLTERAARQFHAIRRRHNRPAAALRVAVLGGDCAGLKYHIGLDEFRGMDDLCVKSRDALIFVDHLSAPYLWGSEIDWIDVDGDAGFVVYNPNAGRSRGGCSNNGRGEGCMTLGDGKSCIKSSRCGGNSCGADKTEIVYQIG
ncbi:MAG TPA: iron-sulfur cluster assembly accessory protein [bacterium]|nr:iron-sulfur cluster assembly accessory protein [Candidatus Omnitrophota bacterium]HOJ58865.1 iron-sulfur cluster assembly accessory protein [bacterium]HOL95942.1 iron-sulfur cluster assembly accessory protein [bacterium]HPO99835.1 iron-sulfur cluster assembly accessory protein [bacterium]HXK92711.1 iron-sulfur cluster assembly accessory protein [bacterium]